MKKIVLSLAGALAATAFAPEAAAVPAFARQTGMACNACHAQHFPILNAFGRAFKAGGYTMMGSQGKIEGDHLSIPDALNASVVLKLRYQDSDGRRTAGTAADAYKPASNPDTYADNKRSGAGVGDGQVQWDEFALFFGGRIAENVGFMIEGNMLAGQLMGGFRMPFVFDVGGAKLSVIPFTTDAMGPQMGYEQSSGGVFRANRWAEHRREISAVQYMSDRAHDGGAASGLAFTAAADTGYISLTKWTPNFLVGANNPATGQSAEFSSSYVRVAATPTVADWALHIGAGKMSGESYSTDKAAAGIAANGLVDTDMTFFDFQAQGELLGKELGVYLQHAKAPNTVNGNIYNPRAKSANPDRKATTIGADYSVIPHVLSIGAAYRSADDGGTAATNGEDAWTVTGVYDMYQNVALHLNYSHYSGSSITDANLKPTKLMTMMLEAAW